MDYLDLKKLTMSLPSVESFENMKSYLKEAVEEMQADNKQFHIDFKKQNEIIRRYDEIMAAKASKIAL